MNDIRTAILKAADHIERNPREFNFNATFVPSRPGCGTPGCAIGWIAAFSGVGFRDAIMLMIGHKECGAGNVFYDRMGELVPRWKDRAALCASALRLYADKYHPATKAVVYPDWTAMAATQTVSMDAVSQEVARV